MYHSYLPLWHVLMDFFPIGNLVLGNSSRLEIILKSLMLYVGVLWYLLVLLERKLRCLICAVNINGTALSYM